MAPNVNFPGNLGSIWIPPNWQKPCSARQWNDGVLTVSSVTSPGLPHSTLFDDVPAGIAPDGSGGAFVLTTCSILVPGSLGPFALRAIGPTGSRSQIVEFGDPKAFIGAIGIYGEAVIVPSGIGRCIVFWGKLQTPFGFAAQQFDRTLVPLWQNGNPVEVSTVFPANTSFCKNSIAAEPDGQDGAIVAWIMPGGLGNNSVQIQRVNSNGGLVWGADGISFGNVTGEPYAQPQTWIQLVGDGKGGAMLVMPETAGGTTQYVAQSIDSNGSPGGASVTIVASAQKTVGNLRLRRAVTDGAGGLFFAYSDLTGALHVLRYTAAGNVSWDVSLATPIRPACFHIREDDRNGFLLTYISASPFPKVELMRGDGTGAITWDMNSVQGNDQIFLRMPVAATAWANDDFSRMALAVPDGAGGAVLVHQNWPDGRKAKLFTVCIDASGKQVSPEQQVSARATSQESPVITSGGGPSAIVAWADDGAAASNGLDVWTQRVGCCIPSPMQELPWPRFGCEIIQFAGLHSHELVLKFPCGNRERQWGVIPLTRLFSSIRGLDYPGSIFNRDVKVPDWIRLTFLGLPEGSKVQLFSMKGKLVGEGKLLSREFRNDQLSHSVLTFKPSPKDDQLLVFSNQAEMKRENALLIQVHSEWGNGKPFPIGQPLSGPKAR